MPRFDDDEDDDRPRSRRRPRDEDDDDLDRPARGRRSRDDDDEDIPPPRAKKKSNLGLILGIVGGVLFLLCGGGVVGVWYLISEAQGTGNEGRAAQNNLKQIGLAVHNHHDVNGAFPNDTYDARGRPLLSWRVHILPYVEQEGLYRQFNLNEPWDGPNNMRLVNQMPKVYGTPRANALAGPGKTYYRGFGHPGAMFEKPQIPGRAPQPIRMAEVMDGTSNTILVVDAGEAVEWTKPDELDWSTGRIRPVLGRPGAATFNALMVDGSVRRIRTTIDDTNLRNLIGRNDGMVIQGGWD